MSVDVSGIEDLVRGYTGEKAACLDDRFVEIARDNAPFLTGDLARSVQSSGMADTGSSWASVVSVGEEYGYFQEVGSGPIHGNPLLAFEVDGELVIVHSTSGYPATHWWSNSVAAWSDVVGACTS